MVFGRELLSQTLSEPHRLSTRARLIALRPLPTGICQETLSCFWAVGKTTKVRQLIPILHPSTLTSPKAATYPPFLHRRLLHNKQHLVLISTQTKTTRGGEEGRDGGRKGGVRGKAAEKNHREAGCEKTTHQEK